MSDLILSKRTIIIFGFVIYSFMISIYVSPFHINGDQVHYTKAYEVVRNKYLIDAWNSYRSIIYTREPLHFLLIWVFSNLGVQKLVLMSTLNSILGLLFGHFLFKKFSSISLVIIIFLSNYYMYAMFFTLERLKISMIFLLIFLLHKNVLWALLSVFSHLQSLLVLLASNLRLFPLNTVIGHKSFIIKRKNAGFLFIFLLILTPFAVAILPHALSKLEYYYTNKDLNVIRTLTPILVMIIVLVLNNKNEKYKIIFYFLFLGIFGIMFGAERINLYIVFGFIYFLQLRSVFKLNQIIVHLSLCTLTSYMFIKSVNYIEMVVISGG